MIGVLWIVVASSFAIFAVIFAVLDSRKWRREHYKEKYGYRASTIWFLFALICGFIAYLMFYPLFHAGK